MDRDHEHAPYTQIEDLYRDHSSEVYNYVYRLMGDTIDPGDATVVAFTGYYKRLQRLREPDDARLFLLAEATAFCRKHARKCKPNTDCVPNMTLAIPFQIRAAWLLVDLCRLRYLEVSEVLNVPDDCVPTYVLQAREAINSLEPIISSYFPGTALAASLA